MLFQLYEIRNLLDVVISFLLVSGYLFIVIAGALNLRREEKLNGSKFFIIIGAVETVYELIKWRSSSLVYMYMESIQGMRIAYAIQWIIPNIISIITFGILIIILGKRNKENFGKSLLLSGIFWIVFAVILLIRNILFGGFFPLNITIITTFVIIGAIVIAFMVVSRIFLLLYASKINEKYLLASSIILLIASMVFIGYTIVDLLAFYLP
ncbi:MAG: hypothetical protein ACFE8M_04450 [Candidatus Hermodarchaeota archaeon]